MKIVAVQLDTAWEDASANFHSVARLIDEYQPPAGSLVVLPELFSAGFTMNVSGVGEPKAGPTATFLARLARDRGLYVLGSVVTRPEGQRGRNEAVAFGPEGRELGRYAKLHPFSPAGEDGSYDAGDEILRFSWEGLRVSPFICYDLRFPEAFRLAALQGVEVIAVPANWPASRSGHWSILLRARALENQSFVIGVNRCGKDPQTDYSGGSLIVDPFGRIMEEAGTEEGCIEAEVDRNLLDEARSTLPCLRDIRTELLGTVQPSIAGPAE